MALSHFQIQMQCIAERELQLSDTMEYEKQILYNEKNRLRIEFRDKMYALWTEYNNSHTYCSLDTFGTYIKEILDNKYVLSTEEQINIHILIHKCKL